MYLAVQTAARFVAENSGLCLEIDNDRELLWSLITTVGSKESKEFAELVTLGLKASGEMKRTCLTS